MKIFSVIVVGLLIFSCSNSSTKNQKSLNVFCASSLTNVMTEIGNAFEAETGMTVQFNFASSGTLARQIEHGAHASVFISANNKWVDYVIKNQGIAKFNSKSIAQNSLVLASPYSSSVSDIPFDKKVTAHFSGRLAMGDPRHVPAGEYAAQALSAIGLGDVLEKRLIPTKDVRSALMLVELGEVEWGIVYKTDAIKSEKVKIVSEVPTDLHETIAYYAANLEGKNDNKTRLFYTFISSAQAQVIWTKHGFIFE